MKSACSEPPPAGSYDLHMRKDRLVAFGPIPLDELDAITKLAAVRGFDQVDALQSRAMHATMVFCSSATCDAWRKEMAEMKEEEG